MSVSLSQRGIPLPGKPDPQLPPSDKPRSRVKQSRQKGDTCWYYALQILRNEMKIGKNPLPHQLEKRKIEVMISNYRKSLTKICDELNFNIKIARQILSQTKKKCTIDVAKLIIKKISKEDAAKPDSKNILKALSEFTSQKKFDDLEIYARNRYEESHLDIDVLFLKEISIPVKEVLDFFVKFFQRELSLTEKKLLCPT